MKPILREGGKVVAYVRDTSNGQELITPGGRLLGTYNEQQDKTFKPGNFFFGTGNQLMCLLED